MVNDLRFGSIFGPAMHGKTGPFFWAVLCNTDFTAFWAGPPISGNYRINDLLNCSSLFALRSILGASKLCPDFCIQSASHLNPQLSTLELEPLDCGSQTAKMAFLRRKAVVGLRV